MIKLGLSFTPIEIHFVPNSIQNSLKNGDHGFYGYDQKKKTYFIFYPEKTTGFVIIHELGHIYFDELLEVRKYEKDLDLKPLNETVMETPSLYEFIRNVIIDSFVNYILTKVDDFYFYLLTIFPDKVLAYNQITKNTSFNWYLASYIYFYIHWNYILTEEDQKKRKRNIEYNLLRLQDIILEKAKKEHILFNEGKFFVLNKVLDKFNAIKDTLDFMKILKYVFQVIISTGIVPKLDLLKEIQARYKKI